MCSQDLKISGDRIGQELFWLFPLDREALGD